ncbi:MAG: M48 family metalloprotease [Candidatus Omnitrophica bacterium]|nr:M48 family metalloprotease [Candidatus Omnitrophota bacterium]
MGHWLLGILLFLSGCAAPQYAMRSAPVPMESEQVQRLEKMVSDQQAREFEKEGAKPLKMGERLWGFDAQEVVERLGPVTERPALHYQAHLIHDPDPNAAALADGRVYVTSGMLQYLASRGSDESELAFVLGHELGHTAAQHIVKRIPQMKRQQLLMSLVGVGAAIAAQRGGSGQQVGGLTRSAAALVNQAILSGFSQEDELEADQLALRYLMKAGYDPTAPVRMLEDFRKFDQGGPYIQVQGVPIPAPFLRSHPYTDRRLQDIQRYLADVQSGQLVAGQPAPSSGTAASIEEQRSRLREAQKLYPPGSQSWKNIQSQLDMLQ